MKKINVGLVTANHYPRLGGMEFVNHFLATYINRIENVKLAVACSELKEIPADYQYNYPCYRAKSFSIFTPYLFLRNQLKMIHSEKINVLHGPMLHGGGVMAMELSHRLKIPFIAQSHGADVQVVKEINYGALLNSESKKKIIEVAKSANKLVAVSSINKQNIIDLGIDSSKIEVIHNGIQFNEIQEVPFEDIKSKYAISPDDFVLITVGRNRPIKRMELLFQALKNLNNLPNLKCICVGPIENLKQLSESYGISDKLIFTGQIPAHSESTILPPFPDLINAYRASNLYVSTSFAESWGGAAADALACGIPVLIGKNHGVQDVIQNDVTGWVMQLDAVEELTELIRNAYFNREKVNSDFISQSVSSLTWENAADKMVDLYKEVLI